MIIIIIIIIIILTIINASSEVRVLYRQHSWSYNGKLFFTHEIKKRLPP